MGTEAFSRLQQLVRKNPARENEAGKSTGERDGPRENETVRGRTGRPVGERDSPREYGAARGRTRRSAGVQGGPWENETVRRSTGRPVGERDGPRGIGIRRYGPGDAADHGDGDSKLHARRTHVTAHVQKERKGRRRLS
ncbi:hypothetical protein WMY93_016801 [Mugilogobius chulae]|uniref:Uncharacterized protein n=1 Tax=Mugilogobius chulae TaxID=88201 RepID=A0AAW0NSW7_9GOBI